MVRELRLEAQELQLTVGNLASLRHEGRFSDDERIVAAIRLQEAIDRAKRELSRHQASRKAALDKQSRVQQLVASAKDGGGKQYNDWMKDLGESEKAIRELDEQVIPDLNARIEEQVERLRESLKGIRATWQAPRDSRLDAGGA